jgi:3-isopropylmalate/(R)-2-methylmalate dehydratase small subunit
MLSMAFEPFATCFGAAAPMPAANIDTDVIMPKHFLKGIDRIGLDAGLFYGLRFTEGGAPDPDFILNRPRWRDTRFLVVGPNFGCGSSREHAVWGLRQFGIRALIGTTFAGIFFDNCARNGLLAVEADEADVRLLMAAASDPNLNQFCVDLLNQTIRTESSVTRFAIDEARKTALVRGLDTVGVTLQESDAIARFEDAHFAQNPWLRP